jgi:hypothetical protein
MAWHGMAGGAGVKLEAGAGSSGWLAGPSPGMAPPGAAHGVPQTARAQHGGGPGGIEVGCAQCTGPPLRIALCCLCLCLLLLLCCAGACVAP